MGELAVACPASQAVHSPSFAALHQPSGQLSHVGAIELVSLINSPATQFLQSVLAVEFADVMYPIGHARQLAVARPVSVV